MLVTPTELQQLIQTNQVRRYTGNLRRLTKVNLVDTDFYGMCQLENVSELFSTPSETWWEVKSEHFKELITMPAHRLVKYEERDLPPRYEDLNGNPVFLMPEVSDRFKAGDYVRRIGGSEVPLQILGKIGKIFMEVYYVAKVSNHYDTSDESRIIAGSEYIAVPRGDTNYTNWVNWEDGNSTETYSPTSVTEPLDVTDLYLMNSIMYDQVDDRPSDDSLESVELDFSGSDNSSTCDDSGASSSSYDSSSSSSCDSSSYDSGSSSSSSSNDW